MGESDAKTIASPFAGGRMGKCGSVLSAEYVLEQIYKEDAAEKIEEFEECYCRA